MRVYIKKWLHFKKLKVLEKALFYLLQVCVVKKLYS
jgi:hypothetical protein